jgi:dynein heavy chain 1
MLDWQIDLKKGLREWKEDVQRVELDASKVTEADYMIKTLDTLRHGWVLGNWLKENRAFLICGPPGSGKTMTLMTTLKSLPNCELVFINFSSTTKPNMILK